jgi:hypothetical protein
MIRHFERHPVQPAPLGAVLDVAGERLLGEVEIERGDAPLFLEQRHDEVHGHRRLAAPSLVIADDDDVRRPAAPLGNTPTHGTFLLRRGRNQPRRTHYRLPVYA